MRRTLEFSECFPGMPSPYNRKPSNTARKEAEEALKAKGYDVDDFKSQLEKNEDDEDDEWEDDDELSVPKTLNQYRVSDYRFEADSEQARVEKNITHLLEYIYKNHG